jgi:uncharacterized protein with GYD domain
MRKARQRGVTRKIKGDNFDDKMLEYKGGVSMAAFLVQFSYTEQGVKGLLKEGGTNRRKATEQLVKSLGGKLVAYYFAFGEYDGFAIIDGLENSDATAAALIVGASGAVKTKTTVLLTPEEVDRATKKSGNYRAPGQ